MTDETAPAAMPAAETTTPADHSPASHHQETQYEQPAHSTPADDYDQQYQAGEQPEGLGDILDEARPKKLSGAQRAKIERRRLESELSAREQHIAERDRRIQDLERFITERDAHDRQTEAERQAEAQRKRDQAHLDRIEASKGSIADFDRALRRMDGVPIHVDLIDAIKESDKSELLTYHLANNPSKVAELNHMSDRERAREIGRLEASLKYPTSKKQTTAPAPPSRVKGGAAPHANPHTGPADMDNFAAWLKKDLAARRRR